MLAPPTQPVVLYHLRKLSKEPAGNRDCAWKGRTVRVECDSSRKRVNTILTKHIRDALLGRLEVHCSGLAGYDRWCLCSFGGRQACMGGHDTTLLDSGTV